MKKYKVLRDMFFAVTRPVMGENLSLKEAKKLRDKLTGEEQDSTYVNYVIEDMT